MVFLGVGFLSHGAAGGQLGEVRRLDIPPQEGYGRWGCREQAPTKLLGMTGA